MSKEIHLIESLLWLLDAFCEGFLWRIITLLEELFFPFLRTHQGWT